MNITVSGIGINATILVQMLNFWIAYFVLRIILFRPVYRFISERNATEETLANNIAGHKKAIAQKEAERRQLWQKCRAYFQKHKPSDDPMGHLALSQITAIAPPSALTDATRKQLVDETYAIISKRLEREND